MDNKTPTGLSSQNQWDKWPFYLTLGTLSAKTASHFVSQTVQNKSARISSGMPLNWIHIWKDTWVGENKINNERLEELLSGKAIGNYVLQCLG